MAAPIGAGLTGRSDLRVKVVIAGGTGQVGGLLRRALNAAGHEVVVLSRHPSAPLEPERAPRRLGRPHARRTGWPRSTGRTPSSTWPAASVSCRYTDTNLRQMMDSRVDSARVVGSAIAGRRPAARHLVADEHRHHLRRPLRRARQPGQRRGDRRDRRRGVPHAALLGVQRADRPALGGGAGGGRPARHPAGRAAHRDGDEPGPRWRLRRPAPADAAGARRSGRRRSAVRLLDPRRRLRRRGDLPAGRTTWPGRSTSPRPSPFRRPS